MRKRMTDKQVEKILFTKFQKILWETSARGQLLLVTSAINVFLQYRSDILEEPISYSKVVKQDPSELNRIRKLCKENKSLRWTLAILLTMYDMIAAFPLAKPAMITALNLTKRNKDKILNIVRTIKDKHGQKHPKLACMVMMFTMSSLLLLPVAVIPAFITEEPSKLVASKLGFGKEYLIIFNANEFSNYMTVFYHLSKLAPPTTPKDIFKRINDDLRSIIAQVRINETDEEIIKKIISSNLKQILSYVKISYESTVRNLLGLTVEIKSSSTKDLKSFAKFLTTLETFKYKRNMKTALITRLIPFFMHILNQILHTKNRTLLAVLIHFAWNWISSAVSICLLSGVKSNVLKDVFRLMDIKDFDPMDFLG